MPETERLVLRPFDPASRGDLEAVLDIHSRMEVIRWLSNPPFTPMTDLAQAREWIDARLAMTDADPLALQWAIVERGTGSTVGGVGIQRLSRLADSESTDPAVGTGLVGEYEIGWRLHPDAGGRGYATEAARALAGAAFDAGMERLVIDMYDDNGPSAGVARRLGAEEIGVVADPWYGGTSLVFELRPEHLAG
ncbi:GNAT family N-acetyltransferase [Arenivirga flava]|uniref:N-acetyltransferase n=1 Tax=Arenivirga flava TaxID=1930060 RepID=A0AA37UHE0_9MICO|nr:GNAT family N-acetyltransferase [Arenivirga flava]GMA28939.1 N-acetyltransferase [Arenivirga flava]